MSEEYGFQLGACHVEHGIRGESSVQDMNFSENLCRELNIEFYCERFDVPEIAKLEKISTEAAGRRVRYEYFADVMEKYGYTLLATAHHLDDKIETVVMNILRGCGLRGFAGIEYKNGNIIRPLLDIRKSEILDFLNENGIEFCTDETNTDVSYTRNRIRHQLLPTLKKFNPSVEESFLRQSLIFGDEDNYLSGVAESAFADCVENGRINISKLTSYHRAIQRRVIYIYLSKVKGTSCDISSGDVEASLGLCSNGATGKSCRITGGAEVRVEYGFFCVSDQEETPEFEYNLTFNKPVVIKELGVKLTLLHDGGNLSISQEDIVTVRNRRDGDFFYPTGMNGSKKLKCFFSDKKIPRSQRERTPIILVNGEIATILGMRDDRRFSACGGTCRVLEERI